MFLERGDQIGTSVRTALVGLVSRHSRLRAQVATSDERGHRGWRVKDHDVGEAVFTKELGCLLWSEGRARRELVCHILTATASGEPCTRPTLATSQPPGCRDACSAGKASRATSGGIKVKGSQIKS